MIEEQFIKEAITPEQKQSHTSTQTMISRELHGMEAVATFDEIDVENYRDNE